MDLSIPIFSLNNIQVCLNPFRKHEMTWPEYSTAGSGDLALITAGEQNLTNATYLWVAYYNIYKTKI